VAVRVEPPSTSSRATFQSSALRMDLIIPGQHFIHFESFQSTDFSQTLRGELIECEWGHYTVRVSGADFNPGCS
jgi:hypothetical protein